MGMTNEQKASLIQSQIRGHPEKEVSGKTYTPLPETTVTKKDPPRFPHNIWRSSIVAFGKKGNIIRFGADFSFCWINLEASWFSLEQNSCCSCRQAFIYFSRLHQVWKGTEKTVLIWTPYKLSFYMDLYGLHISSVFFSSLSDLMKSPAVDESLSTTTTTVLFQRKPTCFKIIRFVFEWIGSMGN